MIRAFRQSPNSQYARAATRRLRESISINERLQTDVGPYVSFVVLPLFALVNAGVRLDADSVMAALRSPLTWGIVAGLVVGKFVGITGATWFMRRTGMGELAPGLTLRRVAGGAALSGIGFTISLFIVDIAIAEPGRQDQARIGVLTASVLAFVVGWAILPDHRLGEPARTGRAEADAARRPGPRPHRGDPRRPADAGRVRRLRMPVLQPGHRLHRRGARPLRRSSCAMSGATFRWSGCIRARSTPHGPARRRRCRASSSRWAGCCSRTRTIWSGRTSIATPMRSGWTSNSSTRTCGCIRRRCCTACSDDAQDAELMDLNSTPTFFVNGKRHKGPWDSASLIRALEADR